MASKRLRVLIIAGAIITSAALWLMKSPSAQRRQAPHGRVGPRESQVARSAYAPPEAAVPSFVPVAGESETVSLPTSPKDSDYDPAALVAALNFRAADLFKKEIRNPNWAEQVQKKIETVLSEDFKKLFPDTAVPLRSHCRSSTCIVEVVFPPALSEAERITATGIPQWAGLGDTVEMDAVGNTYTFFYTVSKRRRDLAAFDSGVASRRRELRDRMLQVDQTAFTTDLQREQFNYAARVYLGDQ